MTALIIDDEKLARTAIKNILVDIPYAPTVVGEASSVASSIALIKKLNPNLIFLDIEMADGTGFDILRALPSNSSVYVIFTTAFDNYAVQAFNFSAINYLLKPIDRYALANAIAQANERFLSQSTAATLQLQALIANYSNPDIKTQKLVLPDKDGYIVKPLDAIVRLEGEGNYTNVMFTYGTSFLSSYSLAHYDSCLENKGFFRIFKSHLVNLVYVTRYNSHDGGLVIMNDGAQLRISPSKKEHFKALFI